MVEENKNDSNLTNDDLDVLRVLLHNVKGLRAASSTPEFVQDKQDD